MHHAITHAATIACGQCGREKSGSDFPAPRRQGKRPPKCWVCRYLDARTPRGRLSALPHSPFGRRPTRLDPAQPPVTRVCRKCGVEKPLADFYLHRARGRRQTPCGACARAYRRQFYAANRDRLRAVQKRYAQEREDPARRRERNARIARKQRVKNAIRGRTQRLRILGLLTLADHCEDCGGPAALVHHETYGEVTALVSLCRRCHMGRHYRHWRKHGGGPVRYPWEYDQP